MIGDHGKDSDSSWVRQLVIALVALLGTAVVIGGLVSVMALGAADVAGVAGNDAKGSPASEKRLYLPATPSASARPEEPAETETTEPRPRRQITVSVSPKDVSTFERVNIIGRYAGADGTTLQVQRDEGRWVDFPTSATVRGGAFATYVETGRSGENRFRVIDESTGRASKAVSVSVG